MSVSGKARQVTHIKSDVKTKNASFNQFVAIGDWRPAVSRSLNS